MTNTNNNKSLHKKHLEAERIVLLPLSEHSMTDDGIDTWYVIIDKENRAPIGMIGMVHQNPAWKNTGLWIVISDEQNRREGYGLEALELVEKYIFDSLAYQRISVRIGDCNQAAVQFFKKAGYKLEGVQELGYFHDDRYYDMILLRLLRKEYMSRQEIKMQ
ncbi:MAG: GNAT family N-acetyltransferase [Lachnospiraceae bacterium]|nr:GNAT family N-acetyltransferase [Lachnospiraceae bacterium]